MKPYPYATIATSANDVYADLVARVMEGGTVEHQRGTTTREIHPAIIELTNPRQRLVTASGRAVNVAFALAEVIWILRGRNDVEMLAHYNSKIGDYSDNGSTFNAAYGERLRSAHGHDQLLDVERTLRADPGSRQATLALILPSADRGFYGDGTPRLTKDRACNVLSHLMIRGGALDWLQIVRSNDLMWGTPYNWMQFTHLQEVMATRLGVPVGRYIHVADSLHIYDWHWEAAMKVVGFDLYSELGWNHAPMVYADTATLTRVEDMEHGIRTRNYLDSYEASQLPRYWQQVLMILRAHAFYKGHADKSCVDQLLMGDNDKVYSATMFKLYWQNRWSKMVDGDEDVMLRRWIVQRATEYFPPNVGRWIQSG